MTRRTLCALLLLALAGSPLLAQGPRGGRGRGGRGAAVPEAMQQVANNIVAMVNAQDGAGLTAMLADGAPFLDEDGHAIPATAWATRITAAPKQMEATGFQGQEWGQSGWVSFNYTLAESFEGQDVTLRGTASFVLENTGGAWMIRMIHGALEQTVAGQVAGD